LLIDVQILGKEKDGKKKRRALSRVNLAQTPDKH